MPEPLARNLHLPETNMDSSAPTVTIDSATGLATLCNELEGKTYTSRSALNADIVRIARSGSHGCDEKIRLSSGELVWDIRISSEDTAGGYSMLSDMAGAVDHYDSDNLDSWMTREKTTQRAAHYASVVAVLAGLDR